MRFWDASSVVPLLIEQDRSDRARRTIDADRELVVWWGTPVGCASAIARLERDGHVDASGADMARSRLSRLRAAWNEVEPSEDVRDRATTLLLRHALRATDALQLGAALVWADGRPKDHVFFSFDLQLASAARREGFAVVDDGR